MTNSNNITPADRVGTVKEYYFSKKLREIAQLNAQGADIISLGIGGPDLPPSQAVIDTLFVSRLGWTILTATNLI